MENETKIKNTLFRFVTLRKPELIDDENKINFFIRHPDFEASNLFASNKEGFKTKLTEFESTPVGALKNAETLKLVNPSLFKLADWVLRNRINLTPEGIALQRNEMTIGTLTLEEEKNIWDNFIYQVASKKDIMAREVAMSLIYGNFILKNVFTESLSADVPPITTYVSVEKNNLKRILQSRILVPSHILYKNEVPVNNTTARLIDTESIIDVKTQLQFNKNIDLLESQALFEDLQLLSKELIKYKKVYQKAEALNKKQYNIAYQALLNAYYAEYPITDDETPPETPIPPVPVYNYTPLEQIDLVKLEEKLTPESFELFNLIGASEADTHQEVKEIIQKNFTKLSQNLFEGKQLSKKYNAYKGVILPPSSARLNDIITYVCSPKYKLKKLRINISFNFGDSSVSISHIDYRLLQDGDVIKQSNLATFTKNTTGVISVGLFKDGQSLVTTNNLSLKVYFKLNTDNEYLIEFPFVVNVPNSGKIESPINIDEELGGVKVNYGITRLGIADYKKVEQSICCYVPGEVSHIENVMAKEYKEKSTKRLRRSENTTTTEYSTETENLTDTTSTERNELQQEISKLQQQSINLNVNVGASYTGNKWNTSLNSGFAYSNNKEESNNLAKTEAKELTERAMERVVSKVREERINKIIDEYTEENKHGFDNRAEGAVHISGVYRWVDKKYKNQILNYGKRLMYEFMIPEPAFLHLRYLQDDENKNLDVLIKPLDPRENGLESTGDVNISTYEKWVSAYNAEVEAHPEQNLTVGKSYSGALISGGAGSNTKEWNDLVIPEGYELSSISCSFEHKRKVGNGVTHRNSHTRSYVNIGNKSTLIGLANYNSTEGDFDHGYSANIREFTISNDEVETILTFNQNTIPISVVTWDVSSFSLNVNAVTVPSDKLYKKWQIETFNAIIQAYEDKLLAYEQKVAALKSSQQTYKESNPLFYREIENLILRKNCIAYMLKSEEMGGLDFQKKESTFNTHAINQTQELEEYASKVKFMEQAFEWEIMSYMFYPFYWGYKERWASLYGQETADNLFTKFLQSGMARVILSVRPGFEDAVTWFLETGEIWNGASTAPVLDEDLYLSIVDELQNPEGEPEGEPWFNLIPSTLTVLQSSGVGLFAAGLPCDCDEEKKEEFIENSDTLSGQTPNEGVGFWQVNPDGD